MNYLHLLTKEFGIQEIANAEPTELATGVD